ncbi:hypothetical protein AURMO_01390 [Aurantimicrobium photophilum]|uniref:Uncharacterized protein n=2 Tax=Aurantimicrobium photophilum TaxID=1987356 RepID=A0A2Z3RZT6_9MICO|nr:hypothetical protein AURMO_01390 [Aurantimicrobium photophilum]
MSFSVSRPAISAALALAMVGGIALGIAGVSYADENDSVPITVQVVTPSVAPSPRTETPVVVPVNTPVSEAVFPIVLSGLEPFSYIEIFANSTPVLIASGFADSTGRFEASVRLPANLPVGDHTISATNTLADGTKLTTVAVAFSVSSSGTIAPPTNGGESVSAAASRSASNAAGTASGTTVTEETVTGADAAVLLGPDPFNLGGVFYVGGLVAHASYPLTPFSPAAQVAFAVRNVSSQTLDATLDFTIENAVGMPIAKLSHYTIQNLKPGETREITALVRNIGQWGVYSARMTFVPPEKVDGNTLTSFSLSSGFIALALWVILGALTASSLVVLYLLGHRFWHWPTPAELFSQLRKMMPFRTHENEEELVAESVDVLEEREPVGAPQ